MKIQSWTEFLQLRDAFEASSPNTTATGKEKLLSYEEIAALRESMPRVWGHCLFQRRARDAMDAFLEEDERLPYVQPSITSKAAPLPKPVQETHLKQNPEDRFSGLTEETVCSLPDDGTIVFVDDNPTCKLCASAAED